jgi:hypothetical protein
MGINQESHVLIGMTIDGADVAVFPNTEELTPGYETRKVKTAFSGQKSVAISYFDPENSRAKFSIDIANIQQNNDVIAKFATYGTHTIVLTYQTGKINTITNAVITEDITEKGGNDGAITLKIEGDRVVPTTSK